MMKCASGFWVLCLSVALFGLGCEKFLDSDSGGANEGIGGVQSAEGPGGFVWKPISESNGRLAVLLPSSFAGKVSGVAVQRGKDVLDQGVFVGNTNGGRPTFRFPRPGGAYGTDVSAVAYLSGGGTARWNIPNGGKRVD